MTREAGLISDSVYFYAYRPQDFCDCANLFLLHAAASYSFICLSRAAAELVFICFSFCSPPFLFVFLFPSFLRCWVGLSRLSSRQNRFFPSHLIASILSPLQIKPHTSTPHRFHSPTHLPLILSLTLLVCCVACLVVMTSLHKLGLRGVRSYSSQSEESIEFLRPLTIIVGANGAGHTERETRQRDREGDVRASRVFVVVVADPSRCSFLIR